MNLNSDDPEMVQKISRTDINSISTINKQCVNIKIDNRKSIQKQKKKAYLSINQTKKINPEDRKRYPMTS